MDVCHAFNGPNGDQAIAEVAIDGTHPSQSGSDLIAGLVADIDTAALTG